MMKIYEIETTTDLTGWHTYEIEAESEEEAMAIAKKAWLDIFFKTSNAPKFYLESVKEITYVNKNEDSKWR